jgi:C4-dicarboxylate transporter, DcuC family
MTLLLGILVISGGVWAITRRVDVRLALVLTALALGTLAGNPAAIVRMFLTTFSNERFVVPICTAMGFAYVLKLTECDQHLVHLLIRPLTRVRPLLIPGTVVVGFLVNIPIISQTSTAVTLGAVAIPILLAARLPAATVGAALLLGSSLGGELLNPGAPELRTVVEDSTRAALALGRPLPGSTETLVARLLPLNLIGLAAATVVFWAMSFRYIQSEVPKPTAGDAPQFRVSVFKAVIPVLPLILLFLTAPPLKLLSVPTGWLVEKPQQRLYAAPVALVGGANLAVGFPSVISLGAITASERRSAGSLSPQEQGLFDCRLIGAAMLIGVVVAALSARQSGLKVAAVFFEGAGYGFTHIISLIVTATCFGEGVKLIGLAALLGNALQQVPALLMPAAGLLPLAFGVLCGSGMATTQSLFSFFAEPALRLGIDPFLVGSVVSLASGAGRTMSPFSAVTLMCGTMTKTEAMKLSLRVAVPLLVAVMAEVIAAMIMAAWE